MINQILNNNFLNDVEIFVNKKLTRKADLDILINNYFSGKNLKEFDDFCFLGKYVNGLIRVLHSSGKITEFKNLDQVKKDVEDNIEKVTSRLREITFSLNEECKIKIEKNYLELSKESFQNIQHLIEDLDHIKKYLNYLKRS